MLLCKGRQAGGGEQVCVWGAGGGSLLSELLDLGTLPAPARVPGKRQQEAPHRGWGRLPGAGTHQVWPASLGMWQQEPGPERARMGTRVGWPGRFAAVMLGGRVGTFCQLEAQLLDQPGCPLAEHLDTWASPCPQQGQNWENQQWTSELPEDGLLWAAFPH